MNIYRNSVMMALVAVALSFGLGEQLAMAAPAISGAFVTNNTTDYSTPTTQFGTQGFWFANFDAKAPASLVPVDQDDANSLPSWVLVDFDPKSAGYSFANGSPSFAYSTGGIAGYNSLTLPDSTTGLSGQLVDDMNTTGTQTSTIITKWVWGPGAPSSARISIVLDNAPTSALTVVQRLRVSNVSADGKLSPNFSYDNLAATANGVADVYTFDLTGIEVGGRMTVQLRSLGAPGGADTALAGIMFAPEPGSGMLMAIGAALVGGMALRRARQKRTR